MWVLSQPKREVFGKQTHRKHECWKQPCGVPSSGWSLGVWWDSGAGAAVWELVRRRRREQGSDGICFLHLTSVNGVRGVKALREARISLPPRREPPSSSSMSCTEPGWAPVLSQGLPPAEWPPGSARLASCWPMWFPAVAQRLGNSSHLPLLLSAADVSYTRSSEWVLGTQLTITPASEQDRSKF